MAGTRVTAEDVAERAGVSRSTVSRTFTPGRTVNKETRRRILKAAKELGYEPNALAQALISRRSQIVGVLMGELSNPIHAVLHQTLGRCLQERGLIPISAHLIPGEDGQGFISMFRQYQVSVVILTSLNVSTALIAALRNEGMKVVLLNRIDHDSTTSAICADITQGGRLAARHLLDNGRCKIGVCRGEIGSWTTEARLTGQIAGIESAGLSPAFICDGGYTYEAGQAFANRLADGDIPMPDALLCPNDLFAIGLMDRLRKRHSTRFPNDLAIIGFDDIPMAAWEGVALTTVRLPIGRMADRTAEVIARHIAGEDALDETVWFPCRIIARATA